jgi:hypothetical protein
MALDDTFVRLLGPEARVWGLNGSLQPLGPPLPYRQFGGFDVFAVMQMVEQLIELPLRIPFGTLHSKPLLHALHSASIRDDLIAHVGNNVPAILVTFADMPSYQRSPPPVLVLIGCCHISYDPINSTSIF